jgi:DNA-binding NtrC family response regulator
MLAETDTLSAPSAEEVPGLVVVFSLRTAFAIPVPLDQGALELGRDHPLLSSLTDPHLSRRHFRIAHDDGRFLVTDLGSRNGTFVDGAPLRPGPPQEVTRVLRAGDTLLIPVRDVGRVLAHGVEVAGERVVGPAQKQALNAAQHAAGIGRTVQIIGEGGSGKEALARAYHAASPLPGGPFQVVRCAALPEGELDQIVLGAGTGGYTRAAHGGTLLLDGVARLSDMAQAKLLHLVARGELLPFGGAPPERIDVRVAVMSRSELRADVEAGTLLEDLYYRLAVPRVTIPPLRERPEEIAFLLEGETARTVPGSSVEASLVEACLLRPWPGNVRELRAEARNAAQAAHLSGASSVGLRFLDPTAGAARAPVKAASPAGAQSGSPSRAPGDSSPSTPVPLPVNAAQLRERIAAALALHGGNVSRAARELGVHRTQLRRWLERFGMDPRT